MTAATPLVIVGTTVRRRARALLLVGMAVGTMACLTAVSLEASAQQSYSDYYRSSLPKTGGGLGTENSNRYLYDKYFYHNPAVSPYMNLERRDTLGGTSYQAYVRPEQQRREAAMKTQATYLQQRKLQGNIGDTRFPGAGFVGGTVQDARLKPVPPPRLNTPTYYNTWYSGWKPK